MNILSSSFLLISNSFEKNLTIGGLQCEAMQPDSAIHCSKSQDSLQQNMHIHVFLKRDIPPQFKAVKLH